MEAYQQQLVNVHPFIYLFIYLFLVKINNLYLL